MNKSKSIAIFASLAVLVVVAVTGGYFISKKVKNETCVLSIKDSHEPTLEVTFAASKSETKLSEAQLKELERGILEIYNDSSNGCSDEYKRWMYGVSMIDQTVAAHPVVEEESASAIAHKFENEYRLVVRFGTMISCDGCIDDEAFASVYPEKFGDLVSRRHLSVALSAEETYLGIGQFSNDRGLGKIIRMSLTSRSSTHTSYYDESATRSASGAKGSKGASRTFGTKGTKAPGVNRTFGTKGTKAPGLDRTFGTKGTKAPGLDRTIGTKGTKSLSNALSAADAVRGAKGTKGDNSRSACTGSKSKSKSKGFKGLGGIDPTDSTDLCTETNTPRDFPAGTRRPSPRPTPRPSPRPTPNPTPEPTPRPTEAPVDLTRLLTPQPTRTVYTPQPTNQPTPEPTPRPTPNPTPEPTPRPTPAPFDTSRLLTPQPTRFIYTPQPTNQPTPEPTPRPTPNPTPEPTPRPTPAPFDTSRLLTPQPTRFIYTPQPTNPPTPEPTPRPTPNPTPLPTPIPTPFPFQPPGVPELDEAETCSDDPCKLNFREDTTASCDPYVEKLITVDSWCGVKWDPWCVTAYSDCFETTNCPSDDIDQIVADKNVDRTRIECPVDETVIAFKEVTPISKPEVEDPTCPPAFPGSGASCDATNLQCFYSYGNIIWMCNCGADPVAFTCKPKPSA